MGEGCDAAGTSTRVAPAQQVTWMGPSKWTAPEAPGAQHARARLSAELGLRVDLVRQVAQQLAEGLTDPDRLTTETQYLTRASWVNHSVGWPGRRPGDRIRLEPRDWGAAVWRARRMHQALRAQRLVEAAMERGLVWAFYDLTVRLYGEPGPLASAVEEMSRLGWAHGAVQPVGRRQVRLVRAIQLGRVMELSDEAQDVADRAQAEYGGIEALELHPKRGGRGRRG